MGVERHHETPGPDRRICSLDEARSAQDYGPDRHGAGAGPLGFGSRASALTAIRLRNSQCVQDQSIAKVQLLRINNNAVGVLDEHIARDAPALMAHNPTTVFASGLSIVLVTVMPTGCGICEHY